MPLLLTDLDDTLIDRTAAFRRGVVDLFARHGLPTADVPWVMELDQAGEAPREMVAAALISRYGLAHSVPALEAALRHAVIGQVTMADATRQSLESAVAAGWTPVIVTNGAADQQEAKIRAVGLDRLVAGWVTSEGDGVAKPDPEIFLAAARLVDLSLDGAWMLGDNAEKDIAGAAALGLRTVWLAHGRRWPDGIPAPTFVADGPVDAIEHVLCG